MKRQLMLTHVRLAALVIAAAVIVAGCDEYPSLSIANGSNADARVTVTAGDRRSSVAVVAGGRLTVEADEGPYTVVVVANKEWLREGLAIRKQLLDQIQSGTLSEDQLRDVFQQFKAIEFRLGGIAYFGKAGAASCSGKIGKNASGGSVTIGQQGSAASPPGLSYTVACN